MSQSEEPHFVTPILTFPHQGEGVLLAPLTLTLSRGERGDDVCPIYILDDPNPLRGEMGLDVLR